MTSLAASRRHVLVIDDDDDDDFEQTTLPVPSAPLSPITPRQALLTFGLGFIESTIESKVRNWTDLEEDFDKEQGDRWYQ